MSFPQDPIYNVRLSIVDLVPASSEEEAIGRLSAAVEKAGFDVYIDRGEDEPAAFESEQLSPDVEAQVRHVWRGGWMRSPRELAAEGRFS